MTTPTSVLTVVVQASSVLLGGCPTALFQVGPDGGAVVVAYGNDPAPASVGELTVRVPVVVDGHLWGLLGSSADVDFLPTDAYDRLLPMATLAAAAIGAAEERTALRRVVDLNGSGVDGVELFAAVVSEASALVRGSVTLWRFDADREVAVVSATPANRRSECEGARAAGDRDAGRSIGVPITVQGRQWGSLVATAAAGQLGEAAEWRLAQFSGLLAAAIAGMRQREQLQRLADEQRALRTVAELVASGQPPEIIFAAVAAEASGLLQGIAITITRFDSDQYQVVEASPMGPAKPGQRIRVEADTLPDRVRVTARPSRVDDYRFERDAELAVEFGLVAAVAVPVIVAAEVWGQLTATSDTGPLPPGVEDRLRQFADLVAAALANIQARREVEALAEEHAALRRVAELASREASPSEVLEAVAREAAQLAGVDFTCVLRFSADGGAEVVGVGGGVPPGLAIGMHAPAGGDGAAQRVWRTGRAARADDLARMFGHWPAVAASLGVSNSAAAPIRIDDALWGVLVVVARNRPVPPDIEAHLSNFSELAGTVIAGTQARLDRLTLAHDQAALRRVAELVAHGVPLDEVFTAVATAASTLLANRGATLTCYVDSLTSVVLAAADSPVPVGLAVSTAVDTAIGEILRTGRPVRIDTYEGTDMAEIARRLQIAATVTVPVVVEGRIWGTLSTASSGPPPPPETEQRLTHFAQLAAAAIANAENKSSLRASRARVVAAADETRRRLQRDVHDSAQQRLVHTIIALQLAESALNQGGDARALVEEALRNARRASQDIRNIIRGILPAALTHGGLTAGLETLLDDLPMPVDLHVRVPRLSTALESTAYFVVAEALTNVAKHAQATQATVDADVTHDWTLVLEVRDDGRGGADLTRGTGLIGLIDRVEANNGTMTLSSPVGLGTTVRVELPVDRSQESVG